VFLSASDFAALMDELELLRGSIRSEVRRQSQGENPNTSVAEPVAGLLAALEQAGVDPTRIAEVAGLIELASALDDSGARGAGLGSIVRVVDRVGRTSEYELIGRPDLGAARQKVIRTSPNAKALLGARPGDDVQVTLANGRQRRVRIVSVTAPDLLRAPFECRAACA
jgi:transcription elongation GreA/GreB family factor